MRKCRLPIVFAISVLAFAASAPAQTTKPTGLSIRAGLFFPADGDARDEGKTWLALGAEYKLGDVRFGAQNPGFGAWYSVSIDTYNKGDYGATPLLFNYVARNNQFYYGAGAGIGFVRRNNRHNESTNQTELAYQFTVGYDFSSGQTPVFVEAKYFGSGESSLNGLGLYAGIRF